MNRQSQQVSQAKSMGPLLTICAYSLAMAISSFVAGLPPLLFELPPEKMEHLSTFSMGILVSAAQVLIIPEGIAHSPEGSPIGLCLIAGFITLFTIDRLSDIARSSKKGLNGYTKMDYNLENGQSSLTEPDLEFDVSSERGVSGTLDDYGRTGDDQVAGDTHPDTTPTIDDDLDSIMTDGPRSATAGTDNSEDGLQQILEESGVDTFKDVWQLKNSRNVRNLLLKGFASAFRNTDTLGLLIHCITDGIALASSLMASSESPSVKSIFVVVAIFLHKLPTAFALVALLVKDGLPKIFVLCHLICFSFAAPLGALATYLVIILFVNESLEGLSGLLLTFSGGSFLYVGFHTLQKMTNSEPEPGTGILLPKSRKRMFIDYIVCLGGMLLPVLVAFLQED